jgi:glycosyltransferase involved in cell wall biosynthesis
MQYLEKNNSLPLISVVIATLNCENCLEKCLESIISQSYSRKEIILIDGLSEDGTRDIIGKYSASISYWESAKDNGIYHAWNKALKHIRGEWVIFLGADDVLYSGDVLSEMAIQLAKHCGMSLVYGCALLDNEHKLENRIGSLWDWSTFTRKMTNIPHPASFHNINMFAEFGIFDESFKIAGDYELLLRGGMNLRAAFVDTVVVRIGSNGVSKNMVVPSLIEARRAKIKNKITPLWRIWLWYGWYRFQVLMRTIS